MEVSSQGNTVRTEIKIEAVATLVSNTHNRATVTMVALNICMLNGSTSVVGGSRHGRN